MSDYLGNFALVLMIGGSIAGYFYPDIRPAVEASSFGLIGIWGICEAHSAMRKRNEAIRRQWEGKHDESAD